MLQIVLVIAAALSALPAFLAASDGPIRRPLQEISRQYPYLGCAREVAHFGRYISWKKGVGVDAWEDILEYELRHTRKLLKTIEAEDPHILNRLKAIRDGLTVDGPAQVREDMLFPYALDYEPAKFWWEELKKQGYQIHKLTERTISDFGQIAEFSKMFVDFDAKILFVNTLFDFDTWLPHQESHNVIDPDTTLVQALAAAYFQLSLSGPVGENSSSSKFFSFMGKRTFEDPYLEKIYSDYEKEDPESSDSLYLTDAAVIFQERWALEQQLRFFRHARRRGWHVNSSILARIEQFDWKNPPRAFLSSFSFYHDVNPELVEALWAEDLPAVLLPRSNGGN